MSYEEFRNAFDHWILMAETKGNTHPETVRALAEARIRLPDTFLSLISAIEDMPERFSVGMVSERTGIDPESVEMALLELEELGVVTNTERVTH